MATLTVRNLPDDVHTALRVRAAKAGRSMEEEVRQLIESAVKPSDVDARVARAQAKVREMFGGELPKGRVDAFIAERRAEAERGE